MEKASKQQVKEIKRLEYTYISWVEISNLATSHVITASGDEEAKNNTYNVSYNVIGKVNDIIHVDELGYGWLAEIDKKTICNHDISNMF